MELVKVSASAGLVPSLCSFNQLYLPIVASRISRNRINIHGPHFYSKESDEERLLGDFQRLKAIQCNAPVIAGTYFSGYVEKCEDGGARSVESHENQREVDTNLLAAWLQPGKILKSLNSWPCKYWPNIWRKLQIRIFRNPDRMDGELESLIKGFFPCESRTKFASWVCFAKGPRPRKPRVWKSRPRIGTVSKSHKLVEHLKALSNVKEEVYGALDAFIAWEVDFPLITVKKALKTLEAEKEWKRIIQITKWMLSKGQGKTMGSYYSLLNALAEEGRIEEAEELWRQIFRRHLEYVPKIFFTRVISMYEQNNMTDKLLEIFADMEELGVKPDHLAVSIVANTLKNLGIMDKYEKLLKKYPQTNWEYHVRKGYRYRVPVQTSQYSGEDMMQHRDNSEMGAEEDKSGKDDFATAEDTEQQKEISML